MCKLNISDSVSFNTFKIKMETMERIWHSLFRRKKKKFATPSNVNDDIEKENENTNKDCGADYETVTVKSKG